MSLENPKISNKVIILSAGQLAQLTLSSASSREIEVILLGDKKGSPAASLINPATGKPFVNDGNNIIVPKLPKGNPNWSDPRTLDLLADAAGDTKVPITTEWENIPAETAEYLENLGFTVYPSSRILRTIQDRKTEKEAIYSIGLKTVPWKDVETTNDVEKFIKDNGGYDEKGYVLKTRKNGYDGHDQVRIKSRDDIEGALKKLKKPGGVIIEKMVDLAFEASVIVARDRHGNIGNLEVLNNFHKDGILRTTFSGGLGISDEMQTKLIQKARQLIEGWKEYVGILTVEFFIDKSGEIYVNELAPRTHNSGHATLDNGGTSQNDLWMDAISGRVIDVVNGTRLVAMQNILTTGALAYYRLADGLYALGNNTKFYDYLKVPPDDIGLGTGVRKVGHLNHFGESAIDIANKQGIIF